MQKVFLNFLMIFGSFSNISFCSNSLQSLPNSYSDPVKLTVKIFVQENKITIYASENFWFVKNEGQYAEKDFKESIDIWKFENLQ